MARANVRLPTPSQIQRQTEPFHPSADTTTFKDLLLFEERLKMNAAMLRRRKRRYEAFLVSLVTFVLFLAHRIAFDPSELPLLRYITQGLLAVGLSTLVLFFASGMYQERIRYAERYVPHANRALRPINMHLNMRQPPRTIRSTLRQLPFSQYLLSESSSTSTSGGGAMKDSTTTARTTRSASPASSISSTESTSSNSSTSKPARSPSMTGALSPTVIPTIPPSLNPRGELIFSSRVDRQFKDGYERYRAAFERRREEKMREARERRAWYGRLSRWAGWRSGGGTSAAGAGAAGSTGTKGLMRSASPMLSDGSRRGSSERPLPAYSSGQVSGRNTPQDDLRSKRTPTPPSGGIANGTAPDPGTRKSLRSSSRDSSAERIVDISATGSSTTIQPPDSPGHGMTRRSSTLARPYATPPEIDPRTEAGSSSKGKGPGEVTAERERPSVLANSRGRAESYSFILGNDGVHEGDQGSRIVGGRRSRRGGDWKPVARTESGSGDEDKLELISE